MCCDADRRTANAGQCTAVVVKGQSQFSSVSKRQVLDRGIEVSRTLSVVCTLVAHLPFPGPV